MNLISEPYRDLLLSHRRQAAWGAGSPEHFALVKEHLIDKHGCRSIVDYGCGGGGLVREIDRHDIEVAGYDPAMPEYMALPTPKEGLCCFDVLEHVEPDRLGDVLEHIGDLFTKAAFLMIHLQKAIHVLPDGRNAHLIIQPAEWWIDALLSCDFEVAEIVGVSKWHLQLVVK